MATAAYTVYATDFAEWRAPSIRASKIEEQFAALAERWESETAHLGSPLMIITHPAYQRIIGMGKDVVPLLIQRLREHPGDWFWALRAITGENPVREADAGNFAAMRAAWLKWAEHST